MATVNFTGGTDEQRAPFTAVWEGGSVADWLPIGVGYQFSGILGVYGPGSAVPQSPQPIVVNVAFTTDTSPSYAMTLSPPTLDLAVPEGTPVGVGYLDMIVYYAARFLVDVRANEPGVIDEIAAAFGGTAADWSGPEGIYVAAVMWLHDIALQGQRTSTNPTAWTLTGTGLDDFAVIFGGHWQAPALVRLEAVTPFEVALNEAVPVTDEIIDRPKINQGLANDPFYYPPFYFDSSWAVGSVVRYGHYAYIAAGPNPPTGAPPSEADVELGARGGGGWTLITIHGEDPVLCTVEFIAQYTGWADEYQSLHALRNTAPLTKHKISFANTNLDSHPLGVYDNGYWRLQNTETLSDPPPMRYSTAAEGTTLYYLAGEFVITGTGETVLGEDESHRRSYPAGVINPSQWPNSVMGMFTVGGGSYVGPELGGRGELAGVSLVAETPAVERVRLPPPLGRAAAVGLRLGYVVRGWRF